MKILIVENNAELQKLLLHLAEKEGFSVLPAMTGAEALAVYAKHKPEIVCLDILLDDMSGFEVFRKIRQQEKLEGGEAFVLIITSKSNTADMETGRALGAEDYIVKPFDVADITARLRQVARKCLARDEPEALGASFDFGDLKVFPGQLTAEREGAGIDLSLRDIAILRLFHTHKGEIVSHAKLMAHCWGPTATPGDKAVDWQIKQLRKKIEIDPEAPALIAPVDETGYRFG
ncbi:MAG: response regulator [Alphaproteobacteria bacterium]|nr:response regulator [Alphaproteobacteria bacterium]